MEIREAILADAPRLAELATELGYPSSEEELARRLPKAMERQPSCVFVAVIDGIVQGWVHVEKPAYLTCDEAAYIIDLVVGSGCRGAGVGAKLVAACERWAVDHGAISMRIRCNITRARTHGFYRRLGYEVAKSQHQFRRSLESSD